MPRTAARVEHRTGGQLLSPRDDLLAIPRIHLIHGAQKVRILGGPPAVGDAQGLFLGHRARSRA